MMINIDVEIERISNGYIATGNDSTKQRCYYRSLVEFAESVLLQELHNQDKYFKEHDTEKLSVNIIFESS
jgi:hypothetical protein